MSRFWDNLASKYDKIMENDSENNEQMFEFIAQYLKSDDKLYDGACGTGFFTVELSKHVNEVIACDLSEKMLKQLRSKIKEKNIDNIQVKNGDLRNIEYDDDSFDVAVAANVLHLLNNPEDALNQLQRIVKDDGIIILPTYITKVQNRIFKSIGNVVFKVIGFNAKSWTEDEYINILNEHDPDIISIKTFKLKRYECIVIIRNKKKL